MKLFKTLSAALLVSSSAMAQGQQPNQPDPQHLAFLQQLMKQQMPVSTQRTTVTKQRLLHSSYWDATSGNAVLKDSADVYYGSTDRGSKFDYNYLQTLDGGDYYNYNPAAANTFVNPGQGGGLNVMYDSVIFYYRKNGGGTRLGHSYQISYNTNKPVDFSLSQYDTTGTVNSINRTQYVYNGNGQVSQLLGTFYNGTIWDSASKVKYYYNAQGKVIRDSSYGYYSAPNWNTTFNAYTYDNNNNVTSITNYYNSGNNVWKPGTRYTITYYNSNQVKKVLYEEGYWGTWTPKRSDSFGYSNNSNIATYWEEDIEMQNSGYLQPWFKMEKHLDAQGVPDSIMDYSWGGGWNQYATIKFKNNSYGNPISGTYYNLATGWKYNYYYYYELYNDTTSTPTPSAINNQTANNSSITVYPNPGTDKLSINWAGYNNGSDVTIRIINTAGQKVFSEQHIWNQNTESINISNLQPGMYWLNMSDAAGKVLHSQGFIKQ